MNIAVPSSALTRHQEILRLLKRGDLKAAEGLCRQLNRDFPHFLAGWYSGSVIASSLGQPAVALDSIDRALARSPTDAHCLLQQAKCFAALRQLPEALGSAASAQRSAAGDAVLLDGVGSFYSSVGEQQRALAAYSSAIALEPRRSLFWFNRAVVRRYLGQLEEAEVDYDRAIALRPQDYEAYANRSELRKQTAESNHVRALEGLLSAGIAHWEGEVHIRHALAKEYEDLEQYELSWKCLESGARLRRKHLQYDVRYDVDTVDWIIETFPAAPTKPAAGCLSREPIFIVGLPRSGSTLIERILGSHSAVFAAGELSHFAAALMDAAHRRNGGKPLPRRELIAATRDLDYAALGSDYLERTRPGTYRRTYFTDKMPLNYLYCGLIRRALPNARIVHVMRHPIASCYAIFKTLFKDGYPFSYDLSDIARYYVSYRRLMDHWRASMPGIIYDIRYERLVMDQPGETARLLAACELEWEEGCLEFHRNPIATTTASAAQVRRPIYDSSVTQWLRYEPQLSGLRAQLVELGIDPAELQ